MYGWRLTHARNDEADDVSGSSSQPPSSATSDAEDLDDAPEEPDAAATGTEGTDSDEDKDYKDYTTFWETRPTRDMSKQLCSSRRRRSTCVQNGPEHRNARGLETQGAHAHALLMRRRYPQFGALLQLAWADESNGRDADRQGAPQRARQAYIVGKLKEKLIKFRTDKGKTVSSIEMFCDECEEVIELECSVLEELDLNVKYANPATASCLALSTLTICDMPTAILARIVELAHGANPFVLTTVSHGFECAVHDYVDGARCPWP
jgi:hypothetical protein